MASVVAPVFLVAPGMGGSQPLLLFVVRGKGRLETPSPPANDGAALHSVLQAYCLDSDADAD